MGLSAILANGKLVLMKAELLFHVEQDGDILAAVCHEPEMATQGAGLEELIAMIRDLIRCRFDDGDERLHWPIRLHFLEDPVLPLQAA
jgi:predicted RNase H-like HicB family nuclease